MIEPAWPRETADGAKKRAETFYKNIREQSVILARHDGDEYVLQKHVNEAFTVLARRGLNRLSWWKRPEVLTTLGGTLFGFAFNLSAALQSVGLNVSEQASNEGTFFLMLVGFALAGYGWMKGAGII